MTPDAKDVVSVECVNNVWLAWLNDTMPNQRAISNKRYYLKANAKWFDLLHFEIALAINTYTAQTKQ